MDVVCPICGESGEDVRTESGPEGATLLDCPRCGDVVLHPDVVETLARADWADDPEARLRLCHGLRRMQRRRGAVRVDMDVLPRLREAELPSIVEQREELVMVVGREGGAPGDPPKLFDARRVQADIGAASWRAVSLIGGQLTEDGLLDLNWSPTPDHPAFKAALTFEGWRFHEELLETPRESRTAFMALQFDDPVLDRMVYEVFRPAVRRTGFQLFRADDLPRAGLIDDHIRVMIRRARFVVADLTHDNPGAYWEAGFAEGLGKPVIFTCERRKFEEESTHFGTSHQHTVTWDPEDPDEAARDLKATIRATLPSEARMADDDDAGEAALAASH